ncbi:hypothetical protein B0H14DRAFT_2735690, partial [Mycena olivaceomarginata]
PRLALQPPPTVLAVALLISGHCCSFGPDDTRCKGHARELRNYFLWSNPPRTSAGREFGGDPCLTSLGWVTSSSLDEFRAVMALSFRSLPWGSFI